MRRLSQSVGRSTADTRQACRRARNTSRQFSQGRSVHSLGLRAVDSVQPIRVTTQLRWHCVLVPTVLVNTPSPSVPASCRITQARHITSAPHDGQHEARRRFGDVELAQTKRCTKKKKEKRKRKAEPGEIIIILYFFFNKEKKKNCPCEFVPAPKRRLQRAGLGCASKPASPVAPAQSASPPQHTTTTTTKGANRGCKINSTTNRPTAIGWLICTRPSANPGPTTVLGRL